MPPERRQLTSDSLNCSNPHEVTTSLLSISAQNRLSLPKLISLGQPILAKVHSFVG